MTIHAQEHIDPLPNAQQLGAGVVAGWELHRRDDNRLTDLFLDVDWNSFSDAAVKDTDYELRLFHGNVDKGVIDGQVRFEAQRERINIVLVPKDDGKIEADEGVYPMLKERDGGGYWVDNLPNPAVGFAGYSYGGGLVWRTLMQLEVPCNIGTSSRVMTKMELDCGCRRYPTTSRASAPQATRPIASSISITPVTLRLAGKDTTSGVEACRNHRLGRRTSNSRTSRLTATCR